MDDGQTNPEPRELPAMADHRIHLRRAWESPEGRVDLPVSGDQLPASSRLWRRFNRPPLDISCERLLLICEDVPGLLEVTLNAQPLSMSGTDHLWDISAEALRSFGNVLELSINPAEVCRAENWGRISLIVRTLPTP